MPKLSWSVLITRQVPRTLKATQEPWRAPIVTLPAQTGPGALEGEGASCQSPKGSQLGQPVVVLGTPPQQTSQCRGLKGHMTQDDNAQPG